MQPITPLHLTLSLAGHGHHAAAGRLSAWAARPDALPDYRALAQHAEACAWSCMLLGTPADDATAPRADMVTMLGSLVAPTAHIGLGARLDVDCTEPFHTARAFAVLDNLSGGRTAWWLNLQPSAPGDGRFGHRPVLDTATHYARAEEYITVVQRLWDSWEHDAVVADKAAGIFADARKIHPIHHRGTHFQVRGPLTAVRPLQGHPVMVVDDLSPEGRRIAARFADVVLATCHDTDEAAALATGLRDAAEACGRRRDALHILLNLMPVLAASDAQAHDRADELEALAPGNARHAHHRFVGTASGCAAHMASWHAASGCDGFNILPPVLPDDATAFIDGVLPLLRAQGLVRSADMTYTAATLRDQLGLRVPGNSLAMEAA